MQVSSGACNRSWTGGIVTNLCLHLGPSSRAITRVVIRRVLVRPLLPVPRSAPTSGRTGASDGRLRSVGSITHCVISCVVLRVHFGYRHRAWLWFCCLLCPLLVLILFHCALPCALSCLLNLLPVTGSRLVLFFIVLFGMNFLPLLIRISVTECPTHRSALRCGPTLLYLWGRRRMLLYVIIART